MKNSISQKRISEHYSKSDCKLIVVTFQYRKRIGTYSGLSIFEALYELATRNGRNLNAAQVDSIFTYIVFREPTKAEGGMCSWKFEDWKPCIEEARASYDEILKINRR